MSNQLTDAEHKALATMKLSHNSEGNGLIAMTYDDKPLLLEQMTSNQRGAFQKFEALSFPNLKRNAAPIEALEAPKTPAPVDTPKVETPKVETPKVETPKVETPKVETPKASEVKTPDVKTPKKAE